jgi:hypothetical protein
MFNSDRFDTQNTEDQYAFLLFDFAVKLGKLKTDDPYFTEVKEELVKLVKERTNSAKFWRERHIELAKEVMRTAGFAG